MYEYEVTLRVKLDEDLITAEIQNLVSERVAEGETIEGISVEVTEVKIVQKPHKCQYCGLLGGH